MQNEPLAYKMRPQTLADIVRQQKNSLKNMQRQMAYLP